MKLSDSLLNNIIDTIIDHKKRYSSVNIHSKIIYHSKCRTDPNSSLIEILYDDKEYNTIKKQLNQNSNNYNYKIYTLRDTNVSINNDNIKYFKERIFVFQCDNQKTNNDNNVDNNVDSNVDSNVDNKSIILLKFEYECEEADMPYITDYDCITKYNVESYTINKIENCEYLLIKIIDENNNIIDKYTCIANTIDITDNNNIKRSIKNFINGIDTINKIVHNQHNQHNHNSNI